MRRLLVGLIWLLLPSVALAQLSIPRDTPTGWIGEGTTWATPWFEVMGKHSGPTVLITGGVHGNEPAGAFAADQIRHWPVKRGRMIVVPRVNRMGLDANMRWFPLTRNDKKTRDLNRNFPTPAAPVPRTPLALEVWRFLEDIQPDLVIDLHEGFDFHISNPQSVGSSIIFCPGKQRRSTAAKIVEAVNASVSDETRKFVLLGKSGPVTGSMARACADRLGIDAFILETTFKDQPISLRTRQQRTMVSILLNQHGVIEDDCTDRLIEARQTVRVNVAVYDAKGTGGDGVRNLQRIIESADDLRFAHVGPADMTAPILKQFDVVVFPGGSGSKQGAAIGEAGRESVRQFVRDGGGITGICAGAFLLSSHYKWSLHVINTAIYNKMEDIPGVGRKSMWYRGGASDVKMEFTKNGHAVFNRDQPDSDQATGNDGLAVKVGLTKVRYQNGPIISKGTNTALPNYRTLAWFRSEVSKYEPQVGTMINSPAIVSSRYGNGRVLSISPHPEATTELREIVAAGLRWAAGQ